MAKKQTVSVSTYQGDEWGPELVVRVNDSALGMSGFVVVDNTALGVGKGGSRMTPDVSLEEVHRLARTMTWKNAMAGIPFGGAKSGIRMPKDLPLAQKKAFIQSFGRAIKPILMSKYIFGPDVNSGEREMEWFVQATKIRGSATGKPSRIGGLPHELGSTGFGVALAAKAAIEHAGKELSQTTVAVEGFGNVGTFAVKFLQEWGAQVVAVGDSRGTAYHKDGLDYATLMKVKKSKGTVSAYPGAQSLSREAIFGMDVDVLIPATVTDVINDSNKSKIRASIIVEGANIPMSETIERELDSKGNTIIPDFVANAGGVISSYAEHKGYSPEKMFKLVKSKVMTATKQMLERAKKTKKFTRDVAVAMAQERVAQAMKKRKLTFK